MKLSLHLYSLWIPPFNEVGNQFLNNAALQTTKAGQIPTFRKFISFIALLDFIHCVNLNGCLCVLPIKKIH